MCIRDRLKGDAGDDLLSHFEMWDNGDVPSCPICKMKLGNVGGMMEFRAERLEAGMLSSVRITDAGLVLEDAL